MIELSDFLEQFFDRADLRRLGESLDITLRGGKEDMIQSMMGSDLTGIELTLLSGFTKYGLQSIARRLGTRTSGTNAEISTQILELIQIPRQHDRKVHTILLNKGRVEKITINVAYLLETFFDKESLQDLCRDVELPVSGTKEDIIDRLVRSKQYRLQEILEMFDKDELSEVCKLLSIRPSFLKSNTVASIISALKEKEGRHAHHEKPVEAIPPVKQTDFEKPGQFSEVLAFLKDYRVQAYEISSRIIEDELDQALVARFGRLNVSRQVPVTGGRIDFEVLGVGVEVKTPSKMPELRQMVAQLFDYRRTYNESLILFLVNAGAKPKDLANYTRQCKQHGIEVIIKE